MLGSFSFFLSSSSWLLYNRATVVLTNLARIRLLYGHQSTMLSPSLELESTVVQGVCNTPIATPSQAVTQIAATVTPSTPVYVKIRVDDKWCKFVSKDCIVSTVKAYNCIGSKAKRRRTYSKSTMKW